MMPMKKSCVVALPIEHNSATFTHKSATSTATTPQPISLKALANRVLERNQTRNFSATSPDKGAQLLHEKVYKSCAPFLIQARRRTV